MTDMLVDFSECPTDPIEALAWLGGVKARVQRELDERYRSSYFQARITGRLDAAIALGLHSRKKVMAYTRQANEANGRMVRWGDGRS